LLLLGGLALEDAHGCGEDAATGVPVAVVLVVVVVVVGQRGRRTPGDRAQAEQARARRRQGRRLFGRRGGAKAAAAFGQPGGHGD
jgi:hypothetical protein